MSCAATGAPRRTAAATGRTSELATEPHLPETHAERAALLQRDGRVDDARRELELARDRYREMVAGRNADRMAERIEELVG